MMMRQAFVPWKLSTDWTFHGWRTGLMIDLCDWGFGAQTVDPGFIAQIGPLLIYCSTIKTIEQFTKANVT